MTENTKPPPKRNIVVRFFSNLGPGLITGAADDDPSGVATYSIAGAQLGTSLLWTAFITWPLMGCVQFMCARIGMVTGQGLGTALGKKFPRWLLISASLALLAANTINIGADLSGMADAADMLTGFNSHIYVVVFGVAIAVATIRFRYFQIARILKYLALFLFAYVITAFVVGPDWQTVIHDTFVPTWPKGHNAWQNLVAILGTTINPYLFYWQTSQEVEHDKAMGRRMLRQRQHATDREIIDRKIDVGTGTFFSNRRAGGKTITERLNPPKDWSFGLFSAAPKLELRKPGAAVREIRKTPTFAFGDPCDCVPLTAYPNLIRGRARAILRSPGRSRRILESPVVQFRLKISASGGRSECVWRARPDFMILDSGNNAMISF
jgi:hypothetical protein